MSESLRAQHANHPLSEMATQPIRNFHPLVFSSHVIPLLSRKSCRDMFGRQER